MTLSAVCASSMRFWRSCYTGKERDTESGNDYFGARYYASTMGRFLSPDWSAKAEPVPYARLANPQSLNLYDYVLNNPLGHVDPDGHTCKAGDWGCNAWNAAAQNWNQIHGVVNQASSKVKEFETNHPRTTKAVKGGLKVATGAATIGVAATGEVGSGGLATVPVVFAVMGGASAIAGGETENWRTHAGAKLALLWALRHGIKIQNRVSCEALKYGRVLRRGVNVAAAF